MVAARSPNEVVQHINITSDGKTNAKAKISLGKTMRFVLRQSRRDVVSGKVRQMNPMLDNSLGPEILGLICYIFSSLQREITEGAFHCCLHHAYKGKELS